MVNMSLSGVLVVALLADVAPISVLMLYGAALETFVVADSVDTVTDFGDVLVTSENKTTERIVVKYYLINP